MSDLFHPDVPFDYITQVFDVMCSWRWPNKEAERSGDESLLEDPEHTFITLTKRPKRVLDWLWWLGEYWPGDSPVNINLTAEGHFGEHVWLGVTAENQQRADERIPILQIPAAVRFISVEPMLGPIRLQRDWLMCPGGAEYGHGMSLTRVHAGGCCDRHPRIHWVVCGSESGPNHRKTKIEWIRDLREQCISANVPFFLKQMEINGRMVKMPELDGKIWAQFPEVQYAS